MKASILIVEQNYACGILATGYGETTSFLSLRKHRFEHHRCQKTQLKTFGFLLIPVVSLESSGTLKNVNKVQ